MSLEQFRAEFCLPFPIFYDRHVPHVRCRSWRAGFTVRFKEVQDSSASCPTPRVLEFCRARGMRTSS